MSEQATKTPTRIAVSELSQAISRALELHGATPADARVQSAQLVEGELRGHPSHGARRLSTLIGRLDRGLIVSPADVRLEWAAPAALTVDGGCGFGPVVAWQALDALMPQARELGAAVAAIRNSHHLGMLSPYVELLVENGLVGLVITTSEGLVHPWGGVGALIGTNPVAIGVPADGDSLILDMSTAAVSMGKILDHADRGVPIPLGWATDAQGQPTTDAVAASAGAISPFGGPKGYALGLAFECIVGLLTRTVFGADVTGTLDTDHPTTKGDLIIALSLERFGAVANTAELTDYFAVIRGSGVNGHQVPVPGDRARAARARALAEGVDIDAATWRQVVALSQGGDSA